MTCPHAVNNTLFITMMSNKVSSSKDDKSIMINTNRQQETNKALKLCSKNSPKCNKKNKMFVDLSFHYLPKKKQKNEKKINKMITDYNNLRFLCSLSVTACLPACFTQTLAMNLHVNNIRGKALCFKVIVWQKGMSFTKSSAHRGSVSYQWKCACAFFV